jgi:cytosine/adenosine deaminase-related metal-dependent hydrolase
MSRILLEGGCVLSLERKVGNFRRADVLIEDDVVSEIGENLRARDTEVIDASDTIVMPGFVDTHRHLWESLFRGHGNTATVAGSHYTADDVYAATLVGLLGAAEAGITTVVDWSEVPIGEHIQAALQAHSDAGLRTVFVHASSDWHSGTRSEGPASPLTTVAAGPAKPDEWALARGLGMRIHAHAGTGNEQAGIDVLASMLGEDVTLVHCCDFDDADLDSVAGTGAHIVLTPSSEMAAGLQPLQIQKLVDRGIRPGLGVDTESMAPGDIFAQMRAAISLQHATLFDLKLAGKAGVPKLLSTRDVIRYATVDGAGAVGLGSETGSLAPGKQADIVVLRADTPNIYPVNDAIGAVVWGMDTSNVDWVFVAGRPVMRNGGLDADLDRARGLAAAAQQRVVAVSPALVETGAGGIG